MNTQGEDQKVAYICEGTCQAKITQEQYDKGLTKCGTESCTYFGKPFKKVKV
ncbi:hypothetical protein HYW44_05210 [Candidatus Daviesbacteria bacterium]|nr:hypothetical protein [Candidatus Daviesbacteria bacterium]